MWFESRTVYLELTDGRIIGFSVIICTYNRAEIFRRICLKVKIGQLTTSGYMANFYARKLSALSI